MMGPGGGTPRSGPVARVLLLAVAFQLAGLCNVALAAPSAEPPGVAAAPATDAALGRFASGDRQGAYPALRKLVTNRVRSPHVYLFAGSYERELERIEAAARTFSAGVAVCPQDISLRLELAVTQSWLGRLEQSLATYRRARALAPKDARPQLGMARVLSWMGQHDQARAIYHRWTSDARFATEAKLGLAFIDRADFQLADARKHYQEVLSDEPDNQEARAGLQATHAMSRTQVQGRVGALVLSDRTLTTFGGLGTFQYDRVWRLGLTYELDGLDVLRDQDIAGQAQGQAVHRVGAFAIARTGQALTLSGGYQALVRPSRIGHAIDGGAAVTPAEGLTLLASSRLYVDRRLSALVSGGVQWAYSPGAFAMLQAFHFEDFGQHRGTFGVLTVQHPLGDAWVPKISATVGDHTQTGVQTTVAGGLTFAGLGHTSIGVSYEYFRANFESHRLGLSSTYRF